MQQECRTPFDRYVTATINGHSCRFLSPLPIGPAGAIIDSLGVVGQAPPSPKVDSVCILILTEREGLMDNEFSSWYWKHRMNNNNKDVILDFELSLLLATEVKLSFRRVFIT